MRLWKQASELLVAKYLRLGKNAMLQIQSNAGLWVDLTLDMLRQLIPAETVEIVTAANTLTAAESGKTFLLASAGGFASTLPAPAAGLDYTFVVSTAPSGGSYTIVTNGGADIMIGAVSETADAAAASPSDDNADTLTFADGVAGAGDWISVVSDGTSWFFRGHTRADGGITTSTT